METKAEREQLAKESSEITRAETLKACKAAKLTPEKTFKAIAAGLQAHETKATYNKDDDKFHYSRKLIDHRTRLTAAALAVAVLDLKPPENKKIEFPDENGKPQQIGGMFTNMERATRLIFLLDQAKKKQDAENGNNGD
jgi:hypothetical protein